MTRLESNREILKILSDFIEKNPEQRFSQALYNLNIVKDELRMVDGFPSPVSWEREVFTESSETLDRVQKRIELFYESN